VGPPGALGDAGLGWTSEGRGPIFQGPSSRAALTGASDDHAALPCPKGCPGEQRAGVCLLAACLLLIPWTLKLKPTRGSASSIRQPARKAREDASPPVAQALDLVFGARAWKGSSCRRQAPSRRLRLGPRGILQVEIIQLVLMSSRATSPSRRRSKKRKKGAKLAQLAAAMS